MHNQPVYKEVPEMNIGQEVSITIKTQHKRPNQNVKGKIIGKTKHIVTIKNGSYPVSICLIDFKIGDAWMSLN